MKKRKKAGDFRWGGPPCWINRRKTDGKVVGDSGKHDIFMLKGGVALRKRNKLPGGEGGEEMEWLLGRRRGWGGHQARWTGEGLRGRETRATSNLEGYRWGAVRL